MKHAHKKNNDTKTLQRINKNTIEDSSDLSLANKMVAYGQNKQNITIKTHKEDSKPQRLDFSS